MAKYVRERVFLARLSIIGSPILILIGIICFIVVNWQVGLTFIALAILNFLLSSVLLQRYIDKREKELGTFIDVKKIRWCKTCRYYKKVKGYENIALLSDDMIELDMIPCKIAADTQSVWEIHFHKETGDRTLYPKDCPKWESK